MWREGRSGVDEGGAVGLHVDLLSNLIIFHFSIINWEDFGELFWREWARGYLGRKEGMGLDVAIIYIL